MAERCKVKGAKKVIWSIKATADFNTRAATSLRAAFQNGNINLLVSEFEAEELVKKIRGFSKMTGTEQAKIKAPYTQTSLMINELINLEHEIKGVNIKIKERSGMRKDRYSSLEYNYYVVQQLAIRLKPKKQNNNYDQIFKIKTPKLGRY